MRRSGPKRFTEEFRREAVRLAGESERTMKELAAELGITPPTLREWIRDPASDQFHSFCWYEFASRARLDCL